MKIIGMLGGMSWESTASYYKLINEGIKQRLGGLHSAKICLFSVDFAEIERLQANGDWNAATEILLQAAKSVAAGGADFLIICTNTMHKIAPAIEQQIAIPLLHIADATAEKLKADNVRKAGLLGTRFTMEQDFYKGRLVEKHSIDVLVPEAQACDSVHEIIYTELCQGVIRAESKTVYLEVMDSLVKQGAEAIILGCTEIALLVAQQDTDIPLYDTTAIHAEKAVQFALEN